MRLTLYHQGHRIEIEAVGKDFSNVRAVRVNGEDVFKATIYALPPREIPFTVQEGESAVVYVLRDAPDFTVIPEGHRLQLCREEEVILSVP